MSKQIISLGDSDRATRAISNLSYFHVVDRRKRPKESFDA